MKLFAKIRLSVLIALMAAFCFFTPPSQDVRAQAFNGSCANIRGSFTGTLTGYASPPTGTVQYRVTQACQVTLWLTAAITGTSNAATMTMTGAPYNIVPSSAIVASELMPNIVQDNGAFTTGCAAVNASFTTLVTFSNTGACSGAMTSSAAKGLPAGWTITYTLN